MGLFKDVYCSECGKKAKLIGRTQLKDGNCICFSCLCKIPTYMAETVIQSYTLDEYHKFKAHMKASNRKLRAMFSETMAFYNLHIDAENRIFYIGKQIDDSTVFINALDIDEFDLVFDAESLKEGVFGDKVTGKILFEITCNNPRFHYEEIIAKDVKAPAKKKMFGTKVEYCAPQGMTEFLNCVNIARLNALQDDLDEMGTVLDGIEELQNAMAIFMIDDMDEVTLNDLRIQRNRLIKAYHPDKGSAADTKYAQKINNAYEILRHYLENHE